MIRSACDRQESRIARASVYVREEIETLISDKRIDAEKKVD